MASWNSAKQNSVSGVDHVVNHVEYPWGRRPERLAVRLAHYRAVRALIFWAPPRGREPSYVTAKPNCSSRTIGKLLVWASVGVLLFSSTGCSRDAQHAQDSGKKIDLTLPKPQVRVQPAQKPADKSEASTEKKVVKKKLESASATAQRGVTQRITSQPDVAPVNGGRVKKQANRTPSKKRESATINSRRPATASMRRDAVGDGVDPQQQESRASEGTKRYQDSDNPLHPSHRKK